MEKLNQLKLIELSEDNLSSTKADLYADGTLADNCYCHCVCNSCNCNCNSPATDETEVFADAYNVTKDGVETLTSSTTNNATDSSANPSTSSSTSTTTTTTTSSSTTSDPLKNTI